jgi:hypothetical protein
MTTMAGNRKRAKLPWEKSNGLTCPKCGCHHLPVYGTKRVGTRVMRYRRCRHCDFGPIITYEALKPNGDGKA